MFCCCLSSSFSSGLNRLPSSIVKEDWPLPPLPDLEISEESVGKVAGVVREAANYALRIAHGITIGRNWSAFIQVAFGLWLMSCVGSLVNLFTLAYIDKSLCGVLLALSVPYIYDRFYDHINPHISALNSMIQTIQ